MTSPFDSSPFDLAEARVSALIAGNDPAALFDGAGRLDDILITAVAACNKSEQDGFKNLLQKAFPHDFRAGQWNQRIREEQGATRLRLVTPGSHEPDPFIRSLNLTIRPILANAITALKRAPEWQGVLAFDEFRFSVVALGTPPLKGCAAGDVWSDQHDRLTAEWLQRAGIYVNVETAGQAVQTVSRETVVHPVRDYLESLSWDGTPRTWNWLTQYLGVTDDTYTQEVGRRWLISAIARVMQPGCKADCCLVLEGRQGSGKSTALKVMAGQWFTDELADFGTKDASQQMQGVWMIELGELDQLRGKEMSRVKAFMSRSTDRFRPPYGHHPIAVPRQCIFSGSTNHDQWHQDETGARRFWPIACEAIDIPGLIRDRDQLWAEAMADYRAGTPWWLDTAELTEAARAQQEQRYDEDIWAQPIAIWIDAGMPQVYGDSSLPAFSSGRHGIAVCDILGHCLRKTPSQWGRADQMRAARCLTSMGYTRFRDTERNEDGKREWKYRLPLRVPVSQPSGQ